jgi:hypothetical protein
LGIEASEASATMKHRLNAREVRSCERDRDFSGLPELGTNLADSQCVEACGVCAGRGNSHSKISNRDFSLSKYTYMRVVQRRKP